MPVLFRHQLPRSGNAMKEVRSFPTRFLRFSVPNSCAIHCQSEPNSRSRMAAACLIFFVPLCHLRKLFLCEHADAAAVIKRLAIPEVKADRF